ncbi:dihydroorotase [Spiromyces aspiralis]|uniref:Dihydroorotase n=1 Tax=Spiromyces aspiralis TaxID=68401 RepID=A0ACC1HDF6_9FUNG|nr:dihydroorotase [Spiromyces aspiralis]
MAQRITLPFGSDFHNHLRQGVMMETVTPLIKAGGIDTTLVMPNLTPPITTGTQAMEYKDQLQRLAPGVEFLMTLYMNPSLTPEEIKRSAELGVVAVKVYPTGVTTNSQWGVLDFKSYYPILAAMQEVDMVLCLHGECPSDPDNNICILNAEEKFLDTLRQIHVDFPRLRIVLEHATTRAAVECVKSLGNNVACTITAHHLYLTIDDWTGQPHHFCKPVAKFPDDRKALREVIREGHPRFFLGSDSAPHLRSAKQGEKPAAGVFTSPILLPLLATLFEQLGILDRLEDFVSNYGRRFYGLPSRAGTKSINLVRDELVVPESYEVLGSFQGSTAAQIVPFMSGKRLPWRLELSA